MDKNEARVRLWNLIRNPDMLDEFNEIWRAMHETQQQESGCGGGRNHCDTGTGRMHG